MEETETHASTSGAAAFPRRQMAFRTIGAATAFALTVGMGTGLAGCVPGQGDQPVQDGAGAGQAKPAEETADQAAAAAYAKVLDDPIAHAVGERLRDGSSPESLVYAYALAHLKPGGVPQLLLEESGGQSTGMSTVLVFDYDPATKQAVQVDGMLGTGMGTVIGGLVRTKSGNGLITTEFTRARGTTEYFRITLADGKVSAAPAGSKTFDGPVPAGLEDMGDAVSFVPVADRSQIDALAAGDWKPPVPAN